MTVVANEKGIFAFKRLADGHHLLIVTAPGHRTLEVPIDLAAGPNKLPAITLEVNAVELDEMKVTGPTSGAQTAFEDKTSSETVGEVVSDAALKNPNAQSTSDYMKGVSGVAVSKGNNGSSNVSVRGIDQRMLRITIDGQRQGGSGNPLDSIPAEIVQSLEVTKTFTPDMDSDAVGGVINVNTGGTVIPQAYTQGRHQVTYNALAPHPGFRNSLTLAQPFKLFAEERNASVLITPSYDDQYANRERLSALREWTPQISPGPSPYTGSAVPVLTLPLIESTLEHKQRSGLLVNSDARFGDAAMYWRSNFTHERVSRDRNLNDTDPASGTPLSLTPQSGVFSGVRLSRRNQEQTATRDAANFSLGSKSVVGAATLDAVLAYAIVNEKEPHTLETGFLSNQTYRMSYDLNHDPYAPIFTFIDESDPRDANSVSDPARYHLDYLQVTASDIEERDGSLKVNVKLNLSDARNYLKFGGKLQQRHRSADVDRDVFDAGAQPLNMLGLVGSSLVELATSSYRFGPVPNAGAVQGLLSTNPGVFAENSTQTLINSTSGDSRVTENLWAAYGMGKFVMGQWTMLGGVRIEGTDVDSQGNQMSLDHSGQLQGFQSVHASNNYVEILPGLHLRYEPSVGLLYRGSITRTMSRPNNSDIAPYRTLSFIDRRSRVGAPDLKPYQATNFDFSIDKYDESYGLVSLALFYKKIEHFITDAQYPVTIGNLGEFIEFRRVNGEAAKAMGLELSWQSPSWSLPLRLGTGSLEANYNFNHGIAHHPTRPGETFPLPRAVDHQAGLKFHDVHDNLSFDTSLTYRSGWWEDLIAAGFDNYIKSTWDAEMSATYKVSKTTRITAGISNLLNLPTSHYAGSQERMNDWQRNGREMNLGIQWKM